MKLIPSAIPVLYKLLPKLYKRKLITSSISVFVMACVDLISLGMLLPILLLVLNENNLSENPYLSFLYQWGKFQSNVTFVYAICSVILMISLVRTLFNTYMQYSQSKRLFSISSYLSLRLYKLYYSKGFLYIKQNNSHRIINKIGAVSSNLVQGYFIPYTSLICELIVVISILVGLILFNVYVFLLVFFTFVPISFLYYRYSQARIKKYGLRLYELSPVKNKLLQQTFVGYTDMEMSNSFPLSEKRFATLMDQINYYSVKNMILNASLQRVLELAVVCSVIVLVIGVQLFDLPALGVIIGLFVIAVYRILPGIVKSIGYFFVMRSNHFALELLDELKQENKNLTKAEEQTIVFHNKIRFDQISFSYDKETPVLQNLSLEIRKGDFIGLKGESGSGKSTLFHLLLGFLHPDSGTVYIDNVPLTDKYMASWHSKIGYVSQQLFMVEGTLLDNIVMGVDVNPNRNRAWEVLNLASLGKFVSDLPQGLDTWVGEGGCLLSGGQRQRLGIARALYKESEILLFDEATSSLDEDTEKAINQAILHLAEERKDLTMLVISHRPESLSICRRVISLEEIQDVNINK